MPQVIAAPDILATAAADLDQIRSVLGAASSTAADPTTGLMAAAEDEVSSAVAKLFADFGQEYQAVVARAAAFHGEFARTLAAAGSSYAQAEATGAALLSGAGVASPAANKVALIMGGTGNPLPELDYLLGINKSYIQQAFPGALWQLLATPEQFWPVTPQLGNLTFGQSVTRAVGLLDSAIKSTITGGNSAVVFGYSQSATVATNEIYSLMAAGSPFQNELSFVLVGNPNNPNGGLLTRFPNFYIPWLDVPFNNPTPPNSPYQTSIYTAQYDGIANAPQYPLNILSDVNAIMGYFYVHNTYPLLTATQVAHAVALPTSPGYAGNTSYYMLMTQDLPLLQPIRDIPYAGPPIADIFQPNLRVLVDLGYSDYGPGLSYANVPTPANLFSIPNPLAVGRDLLIGSVQGPYAAVVEIGVEAGFWGPEWFPDTYPWVPSVNPGLHFYTGQPQTTLLSQMAGNLGGLLDLIPAPVFPE